MTAATLLRTVADSLLELDYETWAFGDSVAFEGMVSASAALGDPRYLAFAHGWIRSWATRAQPYRRLDCTAPGRAMVEVFRATGDSRILSAAVGLADYLLTRPRMESGIFATWEHSPLREPYGGTLDVRGAFLLADPPPGAFIDCLHFDPPFLSALGAETGEDRYTLAALDQATAYIGRLQQADGLFDHFELRGESGTFGPGWGRGQGWALLGLIDTVDATRGADSPERRELAAAALRLIRGMIALQLPDGTWSTDVRDAATGVEDSTSVFMALGFRRALEIGLVPEAERALVGESAHRARTAALAATDSRGRIGVSAAVMACTTPSHYANVPTGFVVPWGQGPLALLLAEENA
ncbi:glycoside hydrolase family 88 protein [Leifsonia naganoensis]|uniref:Unsaturated rhamnogalacturonyl hydrolase n=1 Tax=Leifsonia naganoensis TaxID=150025 RepID=A0A853DSG8_9MICO|nr:glycoside hydrolase family 88 protein [Leifsonia naganoensis]NYK09564.1 unsaturated rhamnogalacturonyl hydrolase [Leifsonia naganoensis]